MTVAQQARLEGFRVSLENRGHTLKTDAGVEVRALIQVAGPGDEEGRGESEEDVIHFIRADYPDFKPYPNMFLEDPETEGSYRVKAVDDRPSDIIVKLTVESK